MRSKGNTTNHFLNKHFLFRMSLWFSLAFLIRSTPCLAKNLPDEIKPYEIATLQSEHIIVRYPKIAEDYAKRAVEYAEYAYNILSVKLNSKVKRIGIYLYDRVDVYLDYPVFDFGNEFTINLWPPEDILEYPYYGEWLEEEIARHIARILVQRTYRDFIHSYNNMMLPLWYLDGFSNLYTFPENPGLPRHHGLIRAIIRSAAIDHAIPDLKRLMLIQSDWLEKSSGEIYGSAFLEYVAEQYGYEALTEWNEFNVSNFRTIEHNSKIIFGRRWSELYKEWVQKEENTVEKYTVEKQFRSNFFLNKQPQIIPGKNAISYVRNDGLRPKAIVYHDLDLNTEKIIVECKGECEHHWSSDGNTLYYTTLVKTSHYESSTLFALPSNATLPQKLSIPGHIRNFTVDNDNIIAVSTLDDKPQIYHLKPDEKNASLIYTAPTFSLIEGITAIDNDQWISSYYDPQKKQFDLVMITFNGVSANITPITNDSTIEMYPFVMMDKSIGFVTENNGYYYLNRISSDNSITQLLHKHDTALIQPVQANDGTLFFTDISYKGMAIAELPVELYSVDNELDNLSDSEGTQSLVTTLPDVETKYEKKFDWSVLIPSSYRPSVGRSSASGWHLGISIENNDFLKHNLYSIYFAWYFQSNVFDLNISYKWNKYRWAVSATASVEQKTYLIDTGKKYQYYPLTTYWASLTTGTDFHFPTLDLYISFTLLTEFTKNNDNSMDEVIEQWMTFIDDKSIDLHRRWTNAIIAKLKLEHIHKLPHTIPGETGYRFQYKMRFEPPILKNYTVTFANIFNLDLAWSMPWREVDVLSLSFMYGLAYTGKPYRYLLEVKTDSGFDFNYFGFSELVPFHGIRSGNMLANNHLIYAGLEYTLPIFTFKKNYFHVPLMIDRIGLGIVADWGVSSDFIDKIDFSSSLGGVGGEFYLDMTALYSYPVRLIFGYERGFGKPGENSFYLWIGLL